MTQRTPYATEADLDQVWGAPLVDNVTCDDAGVRRTVDIAAALLRASSMIDGYASVRYTVPLDLTDAGRDQVVQQCAIIALYSLASTWSELTEIIVKRYEQTIAFLRDVAAGKAAILTTAIGGPGTADPTPISANEPILTANERIFDRRSLRQL